MDIIGHASRRALTKAARSGSLIRICLPRRCTGSSPWSIQRRTVLGLTFKHAATSGIEKRGGTVRVSCFVIPAKPLSARASLAPLGGRGGAPGREVPQKEPVRWRGISRQDHQPLSFSRSSRPSRFHASSRAGVPPRHGRSSRGQGGTDEVQGVGPINRTAGAVGHPTPNPRAKGLGCVRPLGASSAWRPRRGLLQSGQRMGAWPNK